MGQGEAVALPGEEEGLEVLLPAHIRGGIADMADAGAAGKAGEDLPVEDVLHQALALVEGKLPVRAHGGDAAALLSPVLQGLQRQEGMGGGVVHPKEAHDAALLVQFTVLKGFHTSRTKQIRPSS